MTKQEALIYFKRRKEMYIDDRTQEAEDIAIECIEKCEHLIDDTLEMVSEYIDDCVCTYETVHEYLERKGRAMCRYDHLDGSDNE